MESQETQQREREKTIEERKEFEDLIKKNITDKLDKINDAMFLLGDQTFMSGEDTEKILPDTDNKKLENILVFIQKVPFVKDMSKEDLQAFNEKLIENKSLKDKIIKKINEQKQLWEVEETRADALKTIVNKAYNDLKTDLDNAFDVIEQNVSSMPMAAAAMETTIKPAFSFIEQYKNKIKLKNFWKTTLDKGIVDKDEIIRLLNYIQKDFSKVDFESTESLTDKLKTNDGGLYILLLDLEHTHKDLYLQAYLDNLFTMANMKKPRERIDQALSYIYTFLEIWNFSSDAYDVIIDIEKKTDIPMFSFGYRSENNLVLRLKDKKSGMFKQSQDIVLTLHANKRDFNLAKMDGRVKLFKPTHLSGRRQGFTQSYTSDKKYEFISPELLIGNNPSTKNLLDEKYKSVVGGLKSSVDDLETKLKSGNYDVNDIIDVVQVYNTLVSDDGTNIKKYTETVAPAVGTETAPVESVIQPVDGDIRTDEQKIDEPEDATDIGAEIPPPNYDEATADDATKSKESDKRGTPEETAKIYEEKPKKKKEIPPIATIANLNDTGGTSANLYISMNPNRENSLGENVPGIIKLFNKNDSSTQSVAGWIKNLGATEVETEAMDSSEVPEENESMVRDLENRLAQLHK